MLKTERERNICKQYSERNDSGYVFCSECPLRKGTGSYDFRCKANSHYSRKTKSWEYDELKEGDGD